jgi:hypothetical protein
MGRRVNELLEADCIEMAMHTIKDTSYLRRKLDSISNPNPNPKEKVNYAKALSALRVGLITLEKCPHSKLKLFEAAVISAFLDMSELAKAGFSTEPHLLIANEESVRLLGEKLYKDTLTIGEDEPIVNKRDSWQTWANRSLRGGSTFPQHDTAKLDLLENNLNRSVPEINAEHFVYDFDSAKPGWKDVKVEWGFG